MCSCSCRCVSCSRFFYMFTRAHLSSLRFWFAFVWFNSNLQWLHLPALYPNHFHGICKPLASSNKPQLARVAHKIDSHKLVSSQNECGKWIKLAWTSMVMIMFGADRMIWFWSSLPPGQLPVEQIDGFAESEPDSRFHEWPVKWSLFLCCIYHTTINSPLATSEFKTQICLPSKRERERESSLHNH